MVTMAAFKLTAITAVRTVVPIRSSIRHSCFYTYEADATAAGAATRSAETKRRQDFHRCVSLRPSCAKMTPCTIRNIGTKTVGISDHGSICTASEPCPA